MFKRNFILLCVCVVVVGSVWAQHNTSSPYTRYGYGTVLDGGFGQTRAMGGVSYGVRSPQYINANNPASYTSIDSLTFRFEAGASFQISDLKGNDARTSELDGNLEFLAFHFPIKKWMAFSFGIHPYSIVGYDFERTETVASTISDGEQTTTYKYNGSGGITQLYAGVAFKPCEWFSLGGNFQFNFGNISHVSMSTFDTEKYRTYFATTMERVVQVKDVSGNFGVQGTIPMKNNSNVVVGGVVQLKSKVNADATQTIITTDTTILNFDNNFDLPLYFGLGFAYTFLDRWLVGIDYKKEMWSDARFFGDRSFYDRSKISAGGQFLPDVSGRRYFNRVAYRLGANFSKSYYKVNGERVGSFSLTAGMGFPLKKGLNPTVINLAFEYGHNGKDASNMIREQFFKFTLNATINERWFVKRKLN